MSSRRHKRRRQCVGKKRYPTSWDAIHAKQGMGCKGMSVYRCLNCRSWHIGRTPNYAVDRGFIAARDWR